MSNMYKLCLQCNNKLHGNRKLYGTCSKCMPEIKLHSKIFWCKSCGALVRGRSGDYCSQPECKKAKLRDYNNNRRKEVVLVKWIKKCFGCDEEFENLGNIKRRFCSGECYRKYYYGVKSRGVKVCLHCGSSLRGCVRS